MNADQHGFYFSFIGLPPAALLRWAASMKA
jgi:hypothetical protein